jgi:copper chaperone CopZ
MKKKYELNGMSCGGCVSNVKQALLKVPDVKEVEVQLNPQGVVITMNKSISVDELQTQLKKAGHYTIKDVGSNSSA